MSDNPYADMVAAPQASGNPYADIVNSAQRGGDATRGTSIMDKIGEAVRDALEKAGVEFTNGDEPGVKLRKAKAKVLK